MIGTKEVAAILGVPPVTVRKYAQALEAGGYIFERIDGKNREYNDNDITAFTDLVTICKSSGMTIEKGAEMVAAKRIKGLQGSESISVMSNHDLITQYNTMMASMQELLTRSERQADQIERLHKRLDEQNVNLSEIMREMLQTRKLIAASKQKKWWKFWKKSETNHLERDPEREWRKKENRIY